MWQKESNKNVCYGVNYYTEQPGLSFTGDFGRQHRTYFRIILTEIPGSSALCLATCISHWVLFFLRILTPGLLTCSVINEIRRMPQLGIPLIKITDGSGFARKWEVAAPVPAIFPTASRTGVAHHDFRIQKITHLPCMQPSPPFPSQPHNFHLCFLHYILM